jgi:folate-dependent phosphoribosylglycinamide formyltransferase PurN
MNYYNIYFVGSETSLISKIFLYNLINFSKNNKKFKLFKVISHKKNLYKKPSNFKLKIIFFVYFFFNKKYFERLKLIKEIEKKYKNISKQAELSKIFCEDFNNINKMKILKKSILISCGAPIIKKETLQKYLICINYHHAKLPEFRGVNSNGLELHKNKFYTYYSWHYMNEKIDKGFVFFKEKLKINKKIKHLFFYDIKKITSTSKKINKILTLAINQKKNKYSTTKSKNYYSSGYFKKLFDNLKNFSFLQIKKYLEVFGGISYQGLFITKIRKSKKGIKLRDCNISITNIKYLPVYLYKTFRFMKFIK